MKRPNPQSGGGSAEGGGCGWRWSGWEAKRARPNNGCRGRQPEVKWSHAEAMKKKPTGGGDLAITGGGGGWTTELEAKKWEPDSRSCGGRGFGMSWSEAASKTADTKDGREEHVWSWPEAETKKVRACEAGGREVGGDEEEGYEWRWTEAVSSEVLALILRGRVAADDVARGAARVCRAWREAAAAPDVWGDVDIETWCRRINSSAKANGAVRRLVGRACGTLQRLSACCVGDAAFICVAAS